MPNNNLLTRADRAAFTLAEILVVVTIIGIAAAMVVPMIGDTDDIQVAAAARMLISDMEYAQGQAMVTQIPVTVEFNTSTGTYRLLNGAGTVLKHPVTKNNFSVSLSASGYGDTAIKQASFGGYAKVTYDSLGAPGNAGFVTLTAGANGRRIDVAAVTGKTTVTTVSP